MATFVKAPCDEGVIRSGASTRPCTPQVGVWVLVATILGSSMAFIDGSVVNVALQVIQQDLGATATDVQWIVESYSLFLASLILVGGSLYASREILRRDYLPRSACQEALEKSYYRDSADSEWKHIGDLYGRRH
ncbi:MAG: hypothetical protein ACXVAV_06610, partial [Ktedonobacteraceae bacterium]